MNKHTILSLGVVASIFLSTGNAFAAKPKSVEIFSLDTTPSMLAPQPASTQINNVETTNMPLVQHHFQFVPPIKHDPNMGHAPYLSKSDEAVLALVKGNADDFVNQASLYQAEKSGTDALTMKTQSTLIPYFQGFKKFSKDMTVEFYRDPLGNEGYSLYQGFITEDGDQRSFVAKIVLENNEFAVSDLKTNVKAP